MANALRDSPYLLNILSSLRAARTFVLGVAAADLLQFLILSPQGGLPGDVFKASAAAFVFQVLFAGIAAVAVGLMVAFALGGLPAGEFAARLRAGVVNWLVHGTEQEHRARASLAWTATCCVGLVLWASLRGGHEIARTFQRQTNIPAGVVAVQALALCALLVVGPVLYRLFSLLFLSLSRTGFAGRIGLKNLYFVAVLFVVVCATGAALMSHYWGKLRFVPWSEFITVISGVLGVAAVALLKRSRQWPRPVLYSGDVVFAMALIAAVSSGTIWQRDQSAWRAILDSELPLSRHFVPLADRLLDRDGDGFSAFFGHGDCDEGDPFVNPGAIEIPDNSEDEDCDGIDPSFRDLIAKPRWRTKGRKPVRGKYPIVFITNDALMSSHTRLFGYKRNITPNIDSLIEKSVAFKWAFSQGPSTRLSFPSIFTARYDSQVARGKKRPLPFPFLPRNRTMSEILKGHGYRTVAVVPNRYFTKKWRGILQGFDRTLLARPHKKGHNARQVTQQAMRALRGETEDPVFLWVHYFDNHWPYDQPMGVPVFGKGRMDRYDAEVMSADKSIGRLIRFVKRHFHGRPYLLILSSDHGQSFDKRHPKHAAGYDLNTTTLHVPLAFHAPFLKPRVLEGQVGVIDILPTIVDLLEIKGRFKFEGNSLVPQLLRGREERDRVLFSQYFLQERLLKDLDPLVMVGIRNARYSYFHDRRKGRYHLYEYRKDIHDATNLAHRLPQVLRTFRAIEGAWTYHVHKTFIRKHLRKRSIKARRHRDE